MIFKTFKHSAYLRELQTNLPFGVKLNRISLFQKLKIISYTVLNLQIQFEKQGEINKNIQFLLKDVEFVTTCFRVGANK